MTTSKLGKGTVITGHGFKEMLSKWRENEETFVSDLGGQLIRRSHDDGHAYFLAMLSNNPVTNGSRWEPTPKARSSSTR